MENPIDIVRGVYTALAAGDIAALTELTDPEVEIYQSERLPYGGYHRGLKGLRSFMNGVQSSLDSAIEVGDLYIAGDRVIQVGRTRGRARGTGAVFDAPEVHIWSVFAGRVLRLNVYHDDTAILAALEAA